MGNKSTSLIHLGKIIGGAEPLLNHGREFTAVFKWK